MGVRGGGRAGGEEVGGRVEGGEGEVGEGVLDAGDAVKAPVERLAADGAPEVIGDAGVELAMVALDEFDGLLEGACAKEEEECSE